MSSESSADSALARSRRSILKAGTAAAVGGAAFVGQATRAAAQQTGTQSGRKFRAFVAGTIGGQLITNSGWTTFFTGQACSGTGHLFCVQQ